jgi:K+ transporter
MTHTPEHNQVLHERVILVTIMIDDVPGVASAERVKLEKLAFGFHRVVLHYGFMRSPNVPAALRFCERLGPLCEPQLKASPRPDLVRNSAYCRAVGSAITGTFNCNSR